MTDDDQPMRQPSLTWWQIIGSTLAAALGVQSRQNKIRDFSQGRIVHFAAAGVLFTVLFVLLLAGIVKVVLNLTG